MLFKKRVKGGVLLYSLLMAGVFTLLLQFYLARVSSQAVIYQARLQQQQAYVMALAVKKLNHNSTGELAFEHGKATYQLDGEQLSVQVVLNDKSYHYDFVVPKSKQEPAKS